MMNSAPSRYRITRRGLLGLIALWLVVGGVVSVALVLRAPDEAETARDGETVSLHVGGEPVRAEVAATDESRTRGLAGRPALVPGAGMLFVFGGASKHDFWMRGVTFPLDMIWIRGDRVTGVTRNARPASETGLRLYHSPGPVDRVVEVPAGWATSREVGAGDSYRGP